MVACAACQAGRGHYIPGMRIVPGTRGPQHSAGSHDKGGSSKTPSVWRKQREKLLITCGASAGLSAAFNAPLQAYCFLWRRYISTFHRSFSFPPWRHPLLRILYPGMYSALRRYFPSHHPYDAPLAPTDMCWFWVCSWEPWAWFYNTTPV